MGPKKQGFRPRINCCQMALPNFGSPSSDCLSKLGRHFDIKVVLKLKSAKMLFTKKVRLNWYSSMKNIFRKIRMIFDTENTLWKSKIALFDELSPDGDSKSGNFWPKTLLLRIHTACYAKSRYSLMHVHGVWMFWKTDSLGWSNWISCWLKKWPMQLWWLW